MPTPLFGAAGDEVPSQETLRCRPPQLANSRVLVLRYTSKRRSYEHESLQFSSFLRKIADEWEALATTGRIRRKHGDQKQKERENEIQKQERLEWERYMREKEGYTNPSTRDVFINSSAE